MKIIITSPKEKFKNAELVNELEKKGAIFYEEYSLELCNAKELFDDDDKILAIDEVNIKGGYSSVNELLHKMKNVKYICGLSSRYNEFDLETAHDLGIIYCNNPDTTSQSVAELGIMMMFMVLRNFPLTLNSNFDFYGIDHLGREIQSLSVGILGYGNIGSKIASICSQLKMSVKIWSRTKKITPFLQVDVNEILQQDVVFIALPSNNETKKLLNNDLLNELKKSTYIIDISANDDLYDKNILIKLTHENKIAGFGFEEEKSSSNHVSFRGNVVITPHIGWGTMESYTRLYSNWTKNILSCYENKANNVVSF